MGSESKGLSSSPPTSWSPETKEMVRNLSEIVELPETEIFSVLVDCDMDIDATVQRLLSQDTFQEVKSKRERRKEVAQESRPRSSYNGSSARGGRVAGERSFSRNGSYQSCHEENGNNHKGENMSVAPSPSPPSFPSHVKGKTSNQKPESLTSRSGASNANKGGQTFGRGNVVACEQRAPREAACSGRSSSTGYLSMADVVRLGRPSSKGSPDLHPQHATNEPEMACELDCAVCPKSSPDDRAVTEQHTSTSRSSTPEASVVTNADQHSKSSSASNGVGESRCSDSAVPGSVSNFSGPDSTAALSSDVVAAAAVSSAAEKLQCLDLRKEPEMDCAVVLPGHLKSLAGDCSHLSFGSFGLENNRTSASVLSSKQPQDLLEAYTTTRRGDLNRDAGSGFGSFDLEYNCTPTGPRPSDEPRDLVEASTTTRHGDFRRDVGFGFGESLVTSSLQNGLADLPEYDLAAKARELDVPEEFIALDHSRTSPHDSNVDKIRRSTADLSFARTDPVVGNQSIQNRPGFIEFQRGDRLMPSLNAQFLANQSTIPSRHGNTGSSLNSSSILFPQDRQQLPGTAFPQSSLPSNRQRGALPYSQPNLPFEQSGNINMMGYFDVPSNLPRLPSVFQQQAYPTLDNFHQSLAAAATRILPEYRASTDNIRFYSAPSSSTAEYCGYAMPTNVAGLGRNPYNLPSSMVSNSGYDNAGLRPGYSDRALFPSHQQSGGSGATWNPRMQSADLEEYLNMLSQQQQQQQHQSKYHGDGF